MPNGNLLDALQLEVQTALNGFEFDFDVSCTVTTRSRNALGYMPSHAIWRCRWTSSLPLCIWLVLTNLIHGCSLVAKRSLVAQVLLYGKVSNPRPNESLIVKTPSCHCQAHTRHDYETRQGWNTLTVLGLDSVGTYWIQIQTCHPSRLMVRTYWWNPRNINITLCHHL